MELRARTQGAPIFPGIWAQPRTTPGAAQQWPGESASFWNELKVGLFARLRRRPEIPLEPGEIPRSVAIIMDGNSRWAVEHGLTVAAGHREGTRALRRTVEAAIDLGIESLTVYAFSTENWLRPPSEVDELMEIFAETIQRELPDLAEQGVRTRFMGRRDRVSARASDPDGRAGGRDCAPRPPQPLDRLRLWGAGRACEFARRIVEEGLEAEEIDEELFGKYLYAPSFPIRIS